MGADGNHPALRSLPGQKLSPVQGKCFLQIPQPVFLRAVPVLTKLLEPFIVHNHRHGMVPAVTAVPAQNAFPARSFPEQVQLTAGPVQQNPQGIFRVGNILRIVPERLNEPVLGYGVLPVADEEGQKTENPAGAAAGFPENMGTGLQGKVTQHAHFDRIHSAPTFCGIR